MPSPQCENGFTRIANEILEALCKIRIPGRSYQVLNAIFRKSYGFNSKSATFKQGELSKMTGLIRQNVQQELNRLESMNIISVTQKGYVTNIGYALEITFNKHYEKWVASPKKVTSPNSVTCVTQFGATATPLPIVVKENIKKVSRPTQKQNGKTMIPSDFKITEQMVEWFNSQNFERIEIQSATDAFIDYWKSQGKMMKDWTATWRNGMRNAEKWAPLKPKSSKCGY